MSFDPVAVALEVADVLEHLKIEYVIGGSVASTLFGEPRTTMDVDFAVQLTLPRVPELCAALEAGFYVQSEAVVEAAATHSHCNLIHRRSMIKVDLYVRPAEGLYASEIARARRIRLRKDPDAFARVATAEDTLLQKLRWFRGSDGVSERQWRDVLGILKQSQEQLDLAYLERWSHELGLNDLLRRAYLESGVSPG